MTLLFEDGTRAGRPTRTSQRTAGSTCRGRFFPQAAGKRFGAIVESLGARGTAQIVVERAMYSSAAGIWWAAGTDAVATRIR